MILANLPSSPNEVIACLIAGTVFLTIWIICKIIAICYAILYSRVEATQENDTLAMLKEHQDDRCTLQGISIIGTLCFVCSVILYVCGGQITLEKKSGTTRAVFDPLPITIEVPPQKTSPR